jgi:UDP-N-acetylmuramoyl-tripeptide--D-alanyl-D-alanine ligase
MNLPLADAVAATGATLQNADLAPPVVQVSTDTRATVAGDTFVALRGERFDGHDFVEEAVRRGARMLVLDRASPQIAGVATMMVGDTLRAYMALATIARERFAGSVLAITGSAGKTTCKAFAAQLLTVRYGERIAAAPANENNEIGVSKLLLSLTNEAYDAVVVEMGARHYEDIAVLVDIARPDVGILTNIGEAHLEIVGTRERLADMKWALFGRGARAVLNAHDATSLARADTLAHPPHWFVAGSDDDASLHDYPRITALLARSRLVDVAGGRRVFDRRVTVTVPGAYNDANLVAALAGALELGADLTAMSEMLPALRLPPGRFESFSMPGGWRLIYDAYNASPSGMIAALDALAGERAGRTIAVLGSMAELGTESVSLHERVGAHAAVRAGIVLVGGEHAEALERSALAAGSASVVRVGSNGETARWLRKNARPGDVVLLKGARKYHLEEILAELRA